MNWFHNISIRYKLLLSFGLTVVLAGAIAGIGYFNIHAMSKQAHTIQADRLVPVMELGAAEAALFEIALIGRDLAAGQEERQFSDALEKHEHIFEASLDTVGMTNLDAEGRAKLKDVQTAWAAFKPRVDRAREALTSEAADIDRAQARALTDEAHTLIARLESMKEHEVALAGASDKMITSAERTAMVELFGGSGLILVVSIGVALFVARVISNPVRELKAAAQQVSEGNLQVETDIRSKDELGQLSTSFNGMVESIRTSVHEAEEQSRKAEEIAQEAREARAEAQEQQKALRRNVQYILEKMNRLADGDLTVQTEVAGREGAIRELFIGFNEVVATIRDMLIRVADEVRQLAERTAQATSKIEGMIRGIQEETDEAVTSIEKGRDEVEAGIELADEAGSAFKAIIDGVKSVAEQVDSIAAATEEQSTTSEQISQNVESISTVSSEAARGVSEVAQSATQLDELTEDLAMLLDQFDLRQDHQGNAARASTPEDAALDMKAMLDQDEAPAARAELEVESQSG